MRVRPDDLCLQYFCLKSCSPMLSEFSGVVRVRPLRGHSHRVGAGGQGREGLWSYLENEMVLYKSTDWRGCGKGSCRRGSWHLLFSPTVSPLSLFFFLWWGGSTLPLWCNYPTVWINAYNLLEYLNAQTQFIALISWGGPKCYHSFMISVTYQQTPSWNVFSPVADVLLPLSFPQYDVLCFF